MKTPPAISTFMLSLVKQFEVDLCANKSRFTVEGYVGDVLSFLEFAHNQNVRTLKRFDTYIIKAYLAHQIAAGKSSTSVNRYYMSLRAFCKFLRKAKAILEDLMEGVPVPRRKPYTPRVPTIAEIEAMLTVPDLTKDFGLRDRAILEVLYSSGLRASELCDLEIHDYMATNHCVIIRCGKGSKTRTVPLTQSACNWIERYIKEYRGHHEGCLFLTSTGRPMTRQGLSKQVIFYAKHAGVRQVTTHTLRHACATHLLDQGADLRLIQEVLGHASISSTERYTQMSSQKIQERFNQYHPRKETVT
jgi:integrase/recombinase XerD